MIMMDDMTNYQQESDYKAKSDPCSVILTEMMLLAIHDIQKLTQKGIIKNGKCVYTDRTWPRRTFKSGQSYNVTYLNHYSSPSLVNELIDFFRRNEFEWAVNHIYDLEPSDNRGMIEGIKQGTLDGRTVAMRNKERKERYNNVPARLI